MLPNGTVFGCATCHVNPGGGGTRNAFGMAVEAITGPGPAPFWSAELAAMDSDGDGFTNGEELGDPDGDGIPEPGHEVTNPGDPNSHPPDENQPPTVALTGPAEGTELTAPAVDELVADASDPDGDIVMVEFLLGETVVGAVTEPPFALRVDWPPGTHTVTARATDDDGASSTSEARTIVVHAPAEPALEPPSRDGGMLRLEWSGGGGPFVVQTRLAFDEPWCGTGSVFTNREAALPIAQAVGFFRVADAALHAGVPLTAALRGGFERPNRVETEGAGRGTFSIAGNTLTFEIEYAGLSGPATAAHIHGPASMDEPAAVMIDLAPFHVGEPGTEGFIAGSVVLTQDEKAAILGGRAYVNVHTEAYEDGEIRGQILPMLLQANLSGSRERPEPTDTPGRGMALLLLNGDQLSFEIRYAGLSGPAIAAHIHGPADADGTASPLIDLEPFHAGPFGISGSFSGTVTLDEHELAAIGGGLSYVNVHTDDHGAGEIRGQILPNPTAIPFIARLTGSAVRPEPAETDAAGSAILALEGDQLLFAIGFAGLSGPVVTGSVHGPADPEETADPLIGLEPHRTGPVASDGGYSGIVLLDGEQKTAVLDGLAYILLTTEAHPEGEIRGQIIRPGNP